MKRLLPVHKLLLRVDGLIGIDKIAKYLGESEDTVRNRISELGLPIIETLEKDRAFPVLLRRTHDILSEEDSARLLEMPVEEVRKISLEMDFLDIKLGKKPDNIPAISCNIPGYTETAECFREYAKPYFADFDQWEKPFSFLKQFTSTEPPVDVKGTDSSLSTRMMYSYTGTHGDFLLSGEDFYSEAVLSRLKNRGVNAGWMPVLLRDMAPSNIYQEFGQGYETRIRNLKKQVQQAAKYGVKIYLYFNEPRFMPEEFFVKHPESRGMPAPQPGQYGMCTSEPNVRKWIRESTEFIFRSIPDLGGVVLITASENRTNCCSHGNLQPADVSDGLGQSSDTGYVCKACSKRGAQEVLADPANLVYEGICASESGAEVVQWLWGWDFMLDIEQEKKAIANLHKGITVMVDWAKYTPFSVFGGNGTIGEYTLAYVKPSKFAQELIQCARDQGRRVFSKCALVSTVEMNALPYLPVLSNVETLINELQRYKMDGVLACWIFGAYPGRNMEMLNYAGEQKPTEILARKYYGQAYEDALKAWKCFSDGMAYYPTTVSILYGSAINPGPGLKLPLEPEPWRHGMVAMATENIEEMSQPLGSDAMIKGFRKVAEYFTEGLTYLQKAVENSDANEWKQENEKDLGICRACMHHLTSAANYSEFILARNRWLQDRDNINFKNAVIDLLKNELLNSEQMLRTAKLDSRIGYEGSIGYFYTPMEIVEKIYDLQCSIEELS